MNDDFPPDCLPNYPADCPPNYPITEHYSIPPLKHSTTTTTTTNNNVTNTSNVTTPIVSNILYKFPVGDRNIIKKSLNYKNSNSHHKRQRSTISVSECIQTTTDISVYDFPVSQTGSPVRHKKGRHSHTQDTPATTVCANNGNGNDSINTSTTSLRTHEEQVSNNKCHTDY